jgi:hypothetical protein
MVAALPPEYCLLAFSVNARRKKEPIAVIQKVNADSDLDTAGVHRGATLDVLLELTMEGPRRFLRYPCC